MRHDRRTSERCFNPTRARLKRALRPTYASTAMLQPHKGSSETDPETRRMVLKHTLQPHKGSSETVESDVSSVEYKVLQPHKGSSETIVTFARPTAYQLLQPPRVRLKPCPIRAYVGVNMPYSYYVFRRPSIPDSSQGVDGVSVERAFCSGHSGRWVMYRSLLNSNIPARAPASPAGGWGAGVRASA